MLYKYSRAPNGQAMRQSQERRTGPERLNRKGVYVWLEAEHLPTRPPLSSSALSCCACLSTMADNARHPPTFRVPLFLSRYDA